MSVVPIIKAPNQALNTKCEKVKDFDEQTKKIVTDLMDTLLNARNPEGAGLAAPQIGILKRICIVRNFYKDVEDPGKTASQEIVLINPKIISKSKETDVDWEACLSIPDTYGEVERASKIKVKAYDVEGHELRVNASGYLSRIIQHEIDHLDGILFTSKTLGKILSEKELEELYEIDESDIYAG